MREKLDGSASQAMAELLTLYNTQRMRTQEEANAILEAAWNVVDHIVIKHIGVVEKNSVLVLFGQGDRIICSRIEERLKVPVIALNGTDASAALISLGILADFDAAEKEYYLELVRNSMNAVRPTVSTLVDAAIAQLIAVIETYKTDIEDAQDHGEKVGQGVRSRMYLRIRQVVQDAVERVAAHCAHAAEEEL